MKFRRTYVYSSLALAAVLAPAAVQAQGFFQKIGGGVNAAAQPAGLAGGPTLPAIIGSLIGAALALVGVILLGTLLYAGFLYMTAGGSTEKVKTAQGMIRNAIIGLIIIAAAYAITTYILAAFSGTATSGGGK